ncbi:MAG: hypothetical protein WCA21_00455 [Terracidiphilus sp.]
MKARFALVAGFALVACMSAGGQAAGKPPVIKKPAVTAKPKISAEGSACLDCHTGTTPVLMQQWKASEHFKQGVDCYTCHKANADDPAAFEHLARRSR